MASGTAVADSPVMCEDGVCTHTFDYTGASQDFVVPAGVDRISFLLYGASGGSSGFGVSGGAGGMTRGDLGVTPGATVRVLVGQAGSQGQAAFTYGNGGPTYPGSRYGNGGGMSMITLDGTVIAVAGGGGGAGGTRIEAGEQISDRGGSGSGPNTSGGDGSAPADLGYVAATGGSQTAPGTGGISPDGNGTDAFFVANATLAGGFGGSSSTTEGTSPGGGGGGGYYGGGGGGYGQSGAGGAGYASPTVENASGDSGVRLGNGQIQISWDEPAAQLGLTAGTQPAGQVSLAADITGNYDVPTGTASFYAGLASLCTGVTLDSAGHADCDASSLAAGTYEILLSYSGDSIYPGTETTGTLVVVEPAPVVTTQSLPEASASGSYSTQLVATGVGPFTWESKEIPEGLTLTADGLLSGTLTTPGTYEFSVRVYDSQDPAQSTIVVLSLTVAAAPVTSTSAPSTSVSTSQSSTSETTTSAPASSSTAAPTTSSSSVTWRPVTTPSTSSSSAVAPTGSTTLLSPTSTAGPQLSATGVDVAPWAGVGAVLLGAGAFTLLLGRRRASRH
ncbi:hypothetical protein GIS00_14235 [Nakamurella sp. YIM 132087]|uniref:receptor protein-tyrosine kinase n=1 Tax=Nakamurella alba TaxID=2665158 RepID=A0A7K1FLW4_9ACTN|nr:Ig-like domain-containing protein [Nakamurella alba]MTD15098.1 hypothetical protein [Nakamurella alba]